MSGRLARAFRDTDYRAAGAVARIGRPSPEMALLLRRHGARHGSFLSAWNPMARSRPPGWNHRAQARLWQSVRRWHALPARSQPRPAAHARWGEDQIFLLSHSAVALRLARRFRQLAIVSVRQDGSSRLIWLKL